MKRIMFLIGALLFSLGAFGQQTTVVAKQVMAIDSFYLNGVWIKKIDVDRWNSNQGGGGPVYVDTLFIRNDSLIYHKDGSEFRIKIPAQSWDDIIGKPAIPTKVSDLDNDLNFAAINDASASSSTTYSSTKINSLISGAGGGDMMQSVYDPTGVNADAFNYNNLYNQPPIPLQFNPIGGTGIGLSGTYPNITFNGFSGNYSDLIGKPTLFSGSYDDLTDKPNIPPQFNPIAGTNISISGTYPNITFSASGGGSGTDTITQVTQDLTKSISGNTQTLGVNRDSIASWDSLSRKALSIISPLYIRGDTALGMDTSRIYSAIGNKVDKVAGKDLSTNDYTTTEKNKLSSIATGAEVNVQSDLGQSNSSADDFVKNRNNSFLENGKGYITHSDAAAQIADSLANHPGGSADSATFLTHTQASDTYAPLGDFNTLTAPDEIIKISGTPKILGTGTVYLNPAYVAVAKPDDTIPKLDTNLGADNLQNVESASRTYDINGGTLTFEDKTAPVPTRLSLNSTYNFLGTVTDDGLYGTAISQTSDVAANNAVAISASDPGGNTTLKVSRQNGFDFSGGPVSMSQYKNNATGDSVAAFTSTGAIIQKYNYNQPGTTMKFKVEGLNAAAFPYTLTADDSYLIITNVSATTEDNTIDIPVPTLDDDGRRVVIKNASDGSVTLSQTIFKYNGAPLDAIVLAPGDVLRIIAWNQTWYQL